MTHDMNDMNDMNDMIWHEWHDLRRTIIFISGKLRAHNW
jgi:hypothetical protein